MNLLKAKADLTYSVQKDGRSWILMARLEILQRAWEVWTSEDPQIASWVFFIFLFYNV